MKKPKSRSRASAGPPPGPKEGFFGSIPAMRTDPLGFITETAREFGDIAQFHLGPQLIYLVNDPDYIKEILHDQHTNFRKGYELVRPVVGNGLMASEGEFWKRQRRLIQPAFHRNRIAALVGLMHENIEHQLQRWNDYASNNEIVDLEAEMFKIMRYNLVRSMFGLSIEEEIERAGAAFEDGLVYLQQLMKAPFKIMTFLPTRANIQFRKSRKVLDELVYRIIQKRRDFDDGGTDLLSMLMQARDENGNPAMSDLQLRDEVMTLLVTGHETTASALTWTWYLLSRNSEIKDKLQQELQTQVNGQVTFEALANLTYTGAVIDETLRLYPSAWLFARKPIHDFELNGYALSKKARIFLSPFAVHRNPAYWKDPETFRPERFAPDKKELRHPYAYFPFGGGPRYCIGESFALTVMKLVIATIGQRFRIEPIGPIEIKPVPKATLRADRPLHARVNRRN